MGRGLILALGASLALNVFLGSVVAGRLLASPPQEAASASSAKPMRAPDSLPPAAQAAFRESFAAHREELAGERRRIRELRSAAKGALTAPQFDRDHAEAALLELNDAEHAQRTGRTARLLQSMETLSQEDRFAMIEVLGPAVGVVSRHRHRERPSTDARPGTDDRPGTDAQPSELQPPGADPAGKDRSGRNAPDQARPE